MNPLMLYILYIAAQQPVSVQWSRLVFRTNNIVELDLLGKDCKS